ncbi:hypothetical protein EIP91_007778 [Steccherinum ochraceum]|uniref:Uncharacterized protein n=1 Tax=Steccherinum ochraceum TaxID=92696 RepID=A0A4R0R663_9APHY|nr:hypothetical protein EIP91_007778 [Steccherinum ochraceum]
MDQSAHTTNPVASDNAHTTAEALTADSDLQRNLHVDEAKTPGQRRLVNAEVQAIQRDQHRDHLLPDLVVVFMGNHRRLVMAELQRQRDHAERTHENVFPAFSTEHVEEEGRGTTFPSLVSEVGGRAAE